jgi:hypothetical protein
MNITSPSYKVTHHSLHTSPICMICYKLHLQIANHSQVFIHSVSVMLTCTVYQDIYAAICSLIYISLLAKTLTGCTCNALWSGIKFYYNGTFYFLNTYLSIYAYYINGNMSFIKASWHFYFLMNHLLYHQVVYIHYRNIIEMLTCIIMSVIP